MLNKQSPCRIKKVLTTMEKSVLKDCFNMLDKKFPESKHIAEVDRFCPCTHLISYGFNHYCCNDEEIEKFLNSRKSKSSGKKKQPKKKS